MIKERKIKPLSVVVLASTLVCMIFIWYRSTLSAIDSTVESTNVLNFFEVFLRGLGLNVELTDFIIRKTAHFCEFALLGCLVMWSAYLLNYKLNINLLPVGLVCLTTAIIDEIIQIYSPGRSCQFGDVILDFCGAVAGIVFFLLVFAVYRNIINRKVNSYGKGNRKK